MLAARSPASTVVTLRRVRRHCNRPANSPASSTLAATSFETPIMTVFNQTTGTDSINGVSPRATTVSCPSESVSSGSRFSCDLSGPGQLTGHVAVTVTSAQAAFSYTGQAQMQAGSSTADFPLSAKGSLASGTSSTTTSTTSPGTNSATLGTAAFESGIMTAFDKTTGTDTVNGISPKLTSVTCPPGITARDGAKFKCALSGPHSLAGYVNVTETSAQGAFAYTGQAEMLAGSTNANFPLSGHGTA